MIYTAISKLYSSGNKTNYIINTVKGDPICVIDLVLMVRCV